MTVQHTVNCLTADEHLKEAEKTLSWLTTGLIVPQVFALEEFWRRRVTPY